MRIEGPFQFTVGIPCKPEVLGQQYSTQIGGVSVELVFPGIPMEETEDGQQKVKRTYYLLPPDGKTFKIWGDEIDWGSPRQYPRTNSFVRAVLISFDCEESIAEDSSQKVYSAIEKWEDALISYCQLSIKYSLGHGVRHHRNTHQSLKLFSPNGYTQPQMPTIIQGTIYSEDCYLSVGQMMEALAFAATGKELLLEYQMLLSAYEARSRGQNRQAIIDASSAAEICLVKKIKSFFQSKDVDPQLLLKKYRSLGDRFKLVTEIDSAFPISDWANTIVQPRNIVAHNNGDTPGDREVQALIKAVELCLSHYHTGYY